MSEQPQNGQDLQPPYPLLKRKLESGKLIPFLGAGASVSTAGTETAPADDWQPKLGGLPSGTQLANYLAHDVNMPVGVERDLALVSQYYELIGQRSELIDQLSSIFGLDDPPGPSTIHNYLANLPEPQLIVTTNYDRLLEIAFDESGTPYDLIVQSDWSEGDDLLLWLEHGKNEPRMVLQSEVKADPAKRTCIYKIHGSCTAPASPTREYFLITEDDYVEFLVAMMRSAAIPNVFAPHLSDLPLLFLGYGLNDWNLRVLLSRLKTVIGSRNYAIQRSVRPVERRIWQERGIEVFDVDIAEFVGELRS